MSIDPKLRPLWDKNMRDFQILEEADKTNDTVYWMVKVTKKH